MIDEFFQTYLDAWNSGEGDALVACFTEDAAYTDIAVGQTFRGPNEIRQFQADTFHAFPDFRIDLSQVIVDGTGSYALDWTMSGTHLGDRPGLPSTGKPFSLPAASVGLRLDGLITRNTDYWNMASFLIQVGILPLPDTTT